MPNEELKTSIHNHTRMNGRPPEEKELSQQEAVGMEIEGEQLVFYLSCARWQRRNSRGRGCRRMYKGSYQSLSRSWSCTTTLIVRLVEW